MLSAGGGGTSVTVIDTTAEAANVGTLLQRGHSVTATATATSTGEQQSLPLLRYSCSVNVVFVLAIAFIVVS
jgi:hypothetical protein